MGVGGGETELIPDNYIHKAIVCHFENKLMYTVTYLSYTGSSRLSFENFGGGEGGKGGGRSSQIPTTSVYEPKTLHLILYDLKR